MEVNSVVMSERRNGQVVDAGKLVTESDNILEIESAAYLSPEVFDIEMDRIFGSTWVYVGHESEIPQVGDYKGTSIGREPVVMSRTADGRITVIRNRCLHRGALICNQRVGNSKLFRCPYHGWTYSSDGELKGVSYRRGYEGFNPGRIGNLAVPEVDSYRGFVFASLSANVGALSAYLGGAAEAIDNLVDRAPEGRIDIRHGVQRYAYRGNWKLQVENVLDTYHPPFSHESTLEDGVQFTRREGEQRGLDMRDQEPDQASWDRVEQVVFPNGHGYFHQRVDPTERKGPVVEDYRSALERTVGTEKCLQLLSRRIHNAIIYPNLGIQELSLHIRVVRPVSVDRTEVEVYAVKLGGAPEAMHRATVRYLNLTHSASSLIQTDDLECFERQMVGLRCRKPERVVFARGRLHDEVPAPGESRASMIGTSELTQRNQWRRWTELMQPMTSSAAERAI